jgi:hypothetical protein
MLEETTLALKPIEQLLSFLTLVNTSSMIKVLMLRNCIRVKGTRAHGEPYTGPTGSHLREERLLLHQNLRLFAQVRLSGSISQFIGFSGSTNISSICAAKPIRNGLSFSAWCMVEDSEPLHPEWVGW